MKNLNLSFSIGSKLSILEEDENILLAEMYVVSTGESRPVAVDKKITTTKFPLEVIKEASCTLLNKPIVCIWNNVQKDFKNHAYTKQDAKLRIAIGVIPESCDMEYKDVDENTFLVCKVAFWKKYFPEEIKKIATNTLENKPTNISMEISVLDGHYDENDSCYIVEKFKFDGISLLGENILTGIPDAKVDTIKFSAIENLNDVINETNQRYIDYGKQKGDNVNVLTDNQIREILNNALKDFNCYIVDFDVEYVYCSFYDGNYKATLYKVPYTLNIENKTATVDVEKKVKVIRGGYVDVVEGNSVLTYSEALQEVEELKASKAELEEKNTKLEKEKVELEASKAELEEKEKEYSDIKSKKEELETKFNSVNEELTTLKEETVVKYSRLVELEELFVKQEQEELIAQTQEMIDERSAYFSKEESEALMAEFKEKYLSKEGLVTFSTIVKAQTEPKVQAELNALREKLNGIKLEDSQTIDFSSGASIENVKKDKPDNVWTRLGL